MPECTDYEDIDVPVDVCVKGSVEGNQTAPVAVRVRPNEFTNNTTQDLGDKGGFGNGNPKTFNDWATVGTFSGCTVTGSSLKCTLGPGVNRVTVDMKVTVNNCPDNGPNSVYDDCGGVGPHTFSGTKVVKIDPGDCPF